MGKNIVVLFKFDAAQKSMLEAAAPGHRFIYEDRSDVPEEVLENADIIIGNPSIKALPRAKNLQLLALCSAGANQYCAPGVLPKNAVLTNATGAFGLVIAEWLLAMTLSIYNHLPHYLRNQAEEKWARVALPKTMHDSTVLIIGAGDIGSGFAKRAKALGAHTIGIRRTDTAKQSYWDEVYTPDSIDSMLPRADVVALCLPSTPQTYHIIDAKRLALMQGDTVLLNVGRGDAIDTDALCAHLAAGHLLGVGLDVTDPEPLPPGHELWQFDNVFITPHIAGGSLYSGPKDFITQLVADNIRAVLAGTPLRNVVDIATMYRKL